MTFIPTPEQSAALELYAKGGSFAIEAGAGTGKTSTLTLLAASDPNRSVQYVAFNKSIVTEAGTKMPSNVICSTAHSLAMRAVGRKYAHRLKAGRMKSAEIARRLGLSQPVVITYGAQRKVLQPGYLASLVMRSVTNFCQTADVEPGRQHVAYIDGIDLPNSDGSRTYTNNDEVRRWVVPAMQKAWRDLTDPNGVLPYKHEHYLKAWQLEGPVISADVILFDEAQDANPVMLAIVAAQTHAQLVFVGDSQQQIYEFTGAVNALAQVPTDDRTFLTQSFRFGPAVADVANGVLEQLDADLRIVGTPSIPSVVGTVEVPDAILTRTNAEAVTTVLEAQRKNIAVHLIGGGTEVLSFARAARELQEKAWTAHPELACFESWGEVQEYVENDPQGGELKLLVGLVDDFGVDVIEEALGRMPAERDASLIVSTAHKAKGREWDAVRLGSDFPEPKVGPTGQVEPISDGELRLLYVAATRARRRLDVTAVKVLCEPQPPQALPVAQAYLAGVIDGVEIAEEELTAKELTDRYGTRRAGQ